MSRERSQAFDPGLMKAIAREEAQVLLDAGGVEIRTQEIGGDMTVAFIRVPAGWDWGRCWSGCPTTSASVRTGDTC